MVYKMKKKDRKELHQKTKEELTKALREHEGELSKMGVDWFLSKTNDSNAIRKKKKDIARLLTIIAEKSVEEVT